jgi:hypothetical protein
MIINIVQLGFQMGIQLSSGGDMITLRESMRECNSGILKRHREKTPCSPPMCGRAVPAGCAMSPLGPGMCAHDVNISIGGGEEILMIAKASEYIEYLLFVGRVEYRC